MQARIHAPRALLSLALLLGLVPRAGAQAFHGSRVPGQIPHPPVRPFGPRVVLRTVAETGMPAPGAEDGVVFGALTTSLSHTLLVPRIDRAGRVAFMAFLSGPGVDQDNAQSVWAERDGSLGLVARGGNAAPGTGQGVAFRGVPSIELPHAPSFEAGRAAFHAELVGAGIDVTNDEGVWAGVPGDLQLVAREGSPVPGLADVSFGIPFADVDAAGHVSLRSDLRGPGTSAANRAALFTDRSGSLELFLRAGDGAPETEPGTVLAAAPFRAVHANGSSTFAVSLALDGPGLSSFRDEIVYVERGGVLRTLFREGDHAPGAGPGVTFGGSSSSLALNFIELDDRGRVALLVRLGGAIPTRSAVYSDHVAARAGDLSPVALPGERAPGADFDYSFFAQPLLNERGQIVFGAALPDDDGDIFTPAPFAVFSDLDGGIGPAVLPGDATLEGETVGSARALAFADDGTMLLELRIGSSGRSGLWLRDRRGGLHRVAAAGDSFELGPGGPREVARAVTGGMNPAGQAAIRLDFTDGSSAHVVARLAAAFPRFPRERG